ncbi:MAG TPA: tetratricopeptide repeat protein [Syntrophales bacterium]|nr:tetratricopeptide repeat protein [Syntrophales bacterium]
MAEDLLTDEHEEREKKRKKKVALSVAMAVIFAGGLLFFDTFYHLVTTGHVRRGSLLDRISRQVSELSPQEERAIMGEGERLLKEGKIDEARDKILYLVQRAPSSEALYLAGSIYLRQGNVRGAYDYLRESVRLNPQNLAAQEKLGEIFVLVGDFQSAQRQARILSEKDDYRADALLLEAEIAMREGNHPLALKKVSEAFAMKAPTPKKQVFLASLYWRLGERGKASYLIDNLKLSEMDVESLLSLARYYAFTGEEKKAQEIYTFTLTKFPTYPEVGYDYGLYLLGQRRYAEAFDYLEKAHRAMPNVAVIAYHLGRAGILASKMDRVKSLLDVLLARDPRSVLAWRLKGEYHLARGERREAIEALNKVIQYIPEAAYIYALLAELYLKEGELAGAEKRAQQAINLGESTPTPRLVLGEIYLRQGKWEEAKRFYYEVLRSQPHHLVALLMAGDCELNLGNLSRAEELYRQALSIYPQATFIQARLARSRFAAGDRAGALNMARHYYEKHPQEPKAIIEYAQTLLMNGKIDEAEKVLEKGMKDMPREGFLLLAAGDLQLLKGEREKALKVLTRAESVSSNDPNFLINIAARYVAMGNLTDAERVYQSAYRKFPAEMHVVNEVAWFFIDTLRRPDRATEMVEILKKKGQGANEQDTVGWYYFLKGKEKEAEYYLTVARAQDPRNPIIGAHYVLLLDKTGRKKEAKLEAAKIVEKLPPGDLKSRLLSLSQAKDE